MPLVPLEDAPTLVAPVPLDPAELRTQWLSMFERWDEMFELASGLMTDYRVYLLSNIGDLHWAHLDALYGLETMVHGACASFLSVQPCAARSCVCGLSV